MATSPGDNVIDLGPHSLMTAADTLGYAARSELTDVLVVGYCGNDLFCSGSRMSRANALWLMECAKLHIMGKLQDGQD